MKKRELSVGITALARLISRTLPQFLRSGPGARFWPTVGTRDA